MSKQVSQSSPPSSSSLHYCLCHSFILCFGLMYFRKQNISSLAWPIIFLFNLIFPHFSRNPYSHNTKFVDTSHTSVSLYKLVPLPGMPLPWKPDKNSSRIKSCVFSGLASQLTLKQFAFMLSLHPEHISMIFLTMLYFYFFKCFLTTKLWTPWW